MINLNNKRLRDKILAIDFGKSKVGLAFSEKETGLAFALEIIPRDRNFFEGITKIVEEKEVNLIILGQPQWMEAKKDPEMEKLVNFLRNNLKVDVELVNEMFTSRMAQENMKEAGKKNVAQDDAEAARIMLQDWLEKK